MEYTTITWILSGVSSVLFLITVFFLRDYFSSRKQEAGKLSDSIEKLDKTLNSLDKLIAGDKSACVEKHTALNSRLRNHDAQIDSLGNRVNTVERNIDVLKSKVK